MKVLAPDRAVRPAIAADLPFVYGNWLSSFRLSKWAGQVPMATYKAVYTDAIDRLRRRRGALLLVACHPEATPGEADLYGWLLAEPRAAPPAVHYLYVLAGHFRRRGLARDLVREAGIDTTKPWRFTYRTKDSDGLLAAGKLGNARWDGLYARDEER